MLAISWHNCKQGPTGKQNGYWWIKTDILKNISHYSLNRSLTAASRGQWITTWCYLLLNSDQSSLHSCPWTIQCRRIHHTEAGATCYLCVSHRGAQPYMQCYYLILEVKVVLRPGETTLSWLLISWFNSRRMPQFCCMEKNCKKLRYRCSKLGRRTHMLNTRSEVSCAYMQQK